MLAVGLTEPFCKVVDTGVDDKHYVRTRATRYKRDWQAAYVELRDAVCARSVAGRVGRVLVLVLDGAPGTALHSQHRAAGRAGGDVS